MRNNYANLIKAKEEDACRFHGSIVFTSHPPPPEAASTYGKILSKTHKSNAVGIFFDRDGSLYFMQQTLGILIFFNEGNMGGGNVTYAAASSCDKSFNKDIFYRRP